MISAKIVNSGIHVRIVGLLEYLLMEKLLPKIPVANIIRTLENGSEKMKETTQDKARASFKILLISINNLWRYSNVGVDQLAGYLRNKGFAVDILYHHKNLRYEEVVKEIAPNYDFYGFSINSSNYDCCVELAHYIKASIPAAITVFGGGYPTRYYREIFEACTSVDYIILGDGELPMENLLNNIIFGDDLVFEPNIVQYSEIKGTLGEKQPYCNGAIDYYPAWDYFETDKPSRNRRKEYCLQTKNNVCTGKCTFCTERKGAIVYKDINHIVQEINSVYLRFGIKKFFFTDDNILDPNNDAAKSRVSALCDAIQQLGHNLVFKCYIKANSLHDTPEDNALLKKMSETGFKTIFVGLEAGNTADLQWYNKLTTVEENYSIMRMLRKHEIAPQIGFINFNPYSTVDTIKQNYYFLVDIEMDNLFMYVCSYMRVYKYTVMHKKITIDGLTILGEDYLDDKSMYRFRDTKIQELFDFISVYMLPRVRNLDFEFDWLFSFFLECKKINPAAAIYSKDFEDLKKAQLEKIKDFFYILFVENDLEKGKNQVEDFLWFFENLQPRFAELHRNLLEMYINEGN